MSTSTSRKPLKRLSLLQSPPSQSPQPSPALTSPDFSQKRGLNFADAHDVFSTFEKDGSNHPSPISSVSSPIGPSGFPRASRRQSSIYYVSRDNGSEPGWNQGPTVTAGPSSERRQSLPPPRKDRERAENVAATESETIDLTEVPVEPMTLVERHADLLRFIAQKESKCLELRSQLAQHEAELMVLKRKWERVVSRSLKNGLTSDNALLGGLKGGMQGVGRLLAQLGDLSTQGNNANNVGDMESRSSHGSHSSVSTNFTSSSFTHFSQSSMSSVGGVIAEEDPIDVGKASSPVFTSTIAHKRNDSTVRRRPLSCTGESLSGSPSTTCSSSPITPHSGIPFGSSHTLPPSATIKCAPVQAPKQAKGWDSKHAKRSSGSGSPVPGTGASAGSFPPVSSFPGGSAAPLVSWVDSVGKKLIQQPQTQSIQKRATTLLTDASNTLFAAWAAPGKVVSSPQETRIPSPALGQSAMPEFSLLDDDSDCAIGSDGTGMRCSGMKALAPDRPSPVLRPRAIAKAVSESNTKPSTRASEADSEEWNW